jgi:hypothetical protein
MGMELDEHAVGEVAAWVLQLEPPLEKESAGHAAGEVCESASLLELLEMMSISLEEWGIEMGMELDGHEVGEVAWLASLLVDQSVMKSTFQEEPVAWLVA